MELNKAVLDCMQTLRRRLRAETGEDIRLSHSDALPRMLQACHASRSTETRALGRQLAQLSGHSLPVEPPQQPAAGQQHSAATQRDDRTHLSRPARIRLISAH